MTINSHLTSTRTSKFSKNHLSIYKITLAAIAGAMVPIDYLSFVSPETLDALRYLVTFALIASVRPSKFEFSIRAIVLASLLAIGLYKVVSGLATPSPELIRVAIIGVISAVLGYEIAKRRAVRTAFLKGFVFGAFLSSADILLQKAGLPYVGMESPYDMAYSGFSFARTAAAPLFAIAFVLVVAPSLWHRRGSFTTLVARACIGIFLLSGLILTSGRGGVLGLALALTFWTFRTVRARPAQMAFVGVAVMSLLIVMRESFLFQRLTPQIAVQSDTRPGRNSAAFEAYLSAPILGPDPLTPTGEAVHLAHTPLILFAGEAGIVGLVGMIISIGILLFAVFRALRYWSLNSIHGALMGVVILTATLLEPTGFFVGLGKVSLLFIMLDICLQETRVERDGESLICTESSARSGDSG